MVKKAVGDPRNKKKLLRVNAWQPILVKKGGPWDAQGRQNGAKMIPKSVKKAVQKKDAKIVTISVV